MRKKYFGFLIVLIILQIHTSLQAQSPEIEMPEHPTLRDRIVFGGTSWLLFGTITEIELFPVLGYRLTNRLSVMAGPMYSYYNHRQFNYSDNGYGARVLSRFFFTDNIYLQGEIDRMSFGVRGNPFRSQFTYMMAGAGYYNRGGTLELLFILNNPANTRYVNPFLMRFGYIFYLSELGRRGR